MKKQQIQQNFLEKTPKINPALVWSEDNGKITLEQENKGVVNRIAQKLIKKPKISYIHLDEMGNFIWPLIDGTHTVTDIGNAVEVHFGEKAHPLWERLSQYLATLQNYGFITIE